MRAKLLVFTAFLASSVLVGLATGAGVDALFANGKAMASNGANSTSRQTCEAVKAWVTERRHNNRSLDVAALIDFAPADTECHARFAIEILN